MAIRAHGDGRRFAAWSHHGIGVAMTRHIRPERLLTLVKAALFGIVYRMEIRPDGSRRLVAKWKE
jgi:hypothetical protein